MYLDPEFGITLKTLTGSAFRTNTRSRPSGPWQRLLGVPGVFYLLP